MWVVLRAVGDIVQRVLYGLFAGEGVAHLVGHLHLVAAYVAYHGLVRTLPVVGVLAFAPLAFEGRFALAHRRLVVEIPQAALLAGVLHFRGGGLLAGGAGIAGLHLGGFGFLLLALLLLLFFLQCFYHLVDGGVAVGLAHVGEQLKGVLQVDGVGIGH